MAACPHRACAGAGRGEHCARRANDVPRRRPRDGRVRAARGSRNDRYGRAPDHAPAEPGGALCPQHRPTAPRRGRCGRPSARGHGRLDARTRLRVAAGRRPGSRRRGANAHSPTPARRAPLPPSDIAEIQAMKISRLLHGRHRGQVAPAVTFLLAAGVPMMARGQAAPGGTDARGTITADTGYLRPVVVTATRVPFAQAVPTTSTTVITGQELAARGILSVSDALRDVAGAAVVQSGSMGALTSLFLRGGQSGYTKVLLDGVPLNEPGGVFYFQNLTTA